MILLFWILILGAICIRKLNIFPFLVIIFLVSLSYFSAKAKVSDFYSYSNIYNNISVGKLYQTGYGWYVLNNIGRNYGLDYNQYKAVSIAILLTCVFITVKVFIGEYSNLVAGLYLLYPALIDTIQLRFFTALVIVLVGLLFLVQEKKWATITYVIFVLIAATVHTSAYFYLLFTVYPFIGKYISKIKIPLIIVSIILIAFKEKVLTVISFFANNRQLQYFNISSGVTSGSSYVVINAIISIVIVFIINSYIYKMSLSDLLFSEKERKVIAMVYGISIIMFFAIPLVIVSGELIRIFRIMYILSYVSIAIAAKHRMSSILNRVVYKGEPLQINFTVVGILISILSFLINILYLAPAAFNSYF
ncbi:EpsG family protein [Ligilactobacillus equi]|uniref:EpsG family protein n=1 Tax=Ligilactobacillus equi TaxID=137357 RepID=UPI002ED0A58F